MASSCVFSTTYFSSSTIIGLATGTSFAADEATKHTGNVTQTKVQMFLV